MKKPWAEMSDEEREAALRWIVETCLLFGTTRQTAYLVASTFAAGLDRELSISPPGEGPA